ncbi:hypothetical protein PV325_009926 [Microctonus aethiopoides]|nr:hypothetical protein PV325_009926 [Microctonus aethiopoides]
MATVFESPFLSNRLRQIEERYEEPTTFGRCDCTSYSYLALSLVLFTIGTAVTILALGDAADGHFFSNLGHMWLVGPIFICSGLMELAGAQGVSGSGAGTPGPPPYDSITQGQGPSELPPPTYAEAVALLHQAEIHGAKPSNETQPDGSFSSVGTTRAKP